MIFQIKPFEGVGLVMLGMTRDEVRKTLSSKVEAFSKAGSEILTDAFDDLGVYVYYDSGYKCQAVELFSPAVPIFQGQHLLEKPFGHLEQWFKSLDPQAKFEDVGIKSDAVGFGIYAPFGKEEPSQPAEAVIVFKQGYYN